jgi:hypothetical protein
MSQATPAIQAIRKLAAALNDDCVFVGGVVDWFYLHRPLRDIDCCSFSGHLLPGAVPMSGRFFGPKWRLQFQGWFVECFEDVAPDFTHASGVKIQSPAARLQTIQRILALPPNRWTEKKQQRLAPLVPAYQSLLTQAAAAACYPASEQ